MAPMEVRCIIKLIIDRRIACNKDLNAKENSVELIVSTFHKFI